MNEKNNPVRMCIVCKSRLTQKSLTRFQVKNGELLAFCGHGRSFYICPDCFTNRHKLIKTINQKYNLNLSVNSDGIFKEIMANG